VTVFAVIAGGGTAGHTVPAIAVGQALVAAGHDPESIQFVGGQRGSEGRLVRDAGFPIVLLPGRGIARSFTVANLGAIAGLIVAFIRATSLVAKWRPAVVLSVGGYAGVPAAFGAVLTRRPLVLAEQNAVPGLANRVVRRFAKAAAVTYEGTALHRAIVTGNPVRPAVLAVKRTASARREARAALGIPEGRVVIGVTGGSLGARRVNEAVRGLAQLWADRDDVAIHHAVGTRDWPSFAVPEVDTLHYRAVEYEDRMELLLSAADLMIGRAGGSTCAELTAVGLGAVLVPLPGAPGDHQTANARVLEEAGAAVLVPDAECTRDRLAEVVGDLVADPPALERLAKAAASIGRRDAAERVAALMIQHAKGRE
jgi:UDP-N-acetylglucosamine--N-acetylmuramyl-(pentapeptide) pyrophosphoryl-undecaprenol N-acetylglucosamine transferase